jgi:hypothetical protein
MIAAWLVVIEYKLHIDGAVVGPFPARANLVAFPCTAVLSTNQCTSSGFNITMTDRDEPTRVITKIEGVRHVLHCAIRCTLAGEDPFATNILAQSAEKVVVDVLKANGKADPFYEMLNPAHSKEFFNAYREPVNFLKHADTDHDGLLPVYDIVRLTDFAILSTIVRLMALEEPLTSHMRAMLIFMGAQYPNVMNIDAFPALVDAIEQALQRSPTRGTLAAYLAATVVCPTAAAPFGNHLRDQPSLPRRYPAALSE